MLKYVSEDASIFNFRQQMEDKKRIYFVISLKVILLNKVNIK